MKIQPSSGRRKGLRVSEGRGNRSPLAKVCLSDRWRAPEAEGMKFDVIIIGAGVVGAAIAGELSKDDAAIAILEKNLQPAEETSAGNSSVIHRGFDPTPGTLNARLNLLGRKACEKEWFRDLGSPHRKVDSLVLALRAD